MPYIGAGIQKFNTADGLTVSGNASVSGTTALTGNATAAGTLDVTGAITSSAGATITTADNTTQLTLKSTDADASEGPRLDLRRDSASPADSDSIGAIRGLAENDASQNVIYTEIQSKIIDVTDGTEDGEINIQVRRNGTLRDAFIVGSTSVIANEAGEDIDFRVESDNDANAFFVQGSSGNVGIGTNNPSGRLHAQTTHTSTDVTAANSNETLVLGNSGSGDGVYNAMRFGGNQQDMYIISFNNNTQADRRLGFFLGSVAGDATTDERLSIRGDGKVGIGTTSPRSDLELSKDGGGELTLRHTTNSGFGAIKTDSSNRLLFSAGTTSFSEKMRLDGSGNVLVGKTATDFGTDGVRLTDGASTTNISASNRAVLNINRNADDGSLINFTQAGSLEGSISVSGSTVSYNGGHLSRWSQLTDGTKDTSILKGTVMTNLDQMAKWHHEAQAATYYEEGDELLIIEEATYYTDEDVLPDGVSVGDEKTAAIYASVGDEKTPAIAAYDEQNEQLNCMAVSSVEGDVNVAGVFVNWDDDDTDFTADMNIAMTGDMVIRIAKDTTVARGNLLMSAGDGTAKPQGDSYVQDKTIAKVTSTTKSHTYDDGSYLVPCVLMAC